MNLRQELGLADSYYYGMGLFNKAVNLATSNAVRTVDTARDQCSDKGEALENMSK